MPRSCVEIPAPNASLTKAGSTPGMFGIGAKLEGGPEAAIGGPIGLIDEGDDILVDLNDNTLSCKQLEELDLRGVNCSSLIDLAPVASCPYVYR